MRALIALLSLALASAAPPPKATFIPWTPGNYEGLLIPAASPIHFTRWDKEHYAHFSGRFILTGTFVYGCNVECGPPMQSADIEADVIPDPAMAARLPRWKLRNGDLLIYLVDGERLAKQIVTRNERAALLAGKVPDVRKHVAIVVDDFQAGIECDSAFYSARFIAIAKPVQVARGKTEPNYGCG
jgi:hypothetical protein